MQTCLLIACILLIAVSLTNREKGLFATIPLLVLTAITLVVVLIRKKKKEKNHYYSDSNTGLSNSVPFVHNTNGSESNHIYDSILSLQSDQAPEDSASEVQAEICDGSFQIYYEQTAPKQRIVSSSVQNAAWTSALIGTRKLFDITRTHGTALNRHQTTEQHLNQACKCHGYETISGYERVHYDQTTEALFSDLLCKNSVYEQISGYEQIRGYEHVHYHPVLEQLFGTEDFKL